MSNKSNTGMSTTKVLMHVQMAASIVPIFAHIALAIMAWMQNNWMMLRQCQEFCVNSTSCQSSYQSNNICFSTKSKYYWISNFSCRS